MQFREEVSMSKLETTGERAAERVQEFANYPDNSLGQQFRDLSEVPSLHEVVLNHFKKHN